MQRVLFKTSWTSYILTIKEQLYFTNICKDINTAAFLFILNILAEMFKGLLLLSFIWGGGGVGNPNKTRNLTISSLIYFFHESK